MENTKDKILAKIKEIEYNPLHYMSLGSKELFHSNFWFWMFKNDPKSINCFFNNINVDEVNSYTREEKNRDITIHLHNNSSYIIENKIKSIPNEEQLLNYQEGAVSFSEGIITGIYKPSFLNKSKFPKWSFLSYENIYTNISNYLDKNRDIKNYELILNYVDYLRVLYSILTDVGAIYSKKIINGTDEIIEQLENVKLADLCKKLNMELLADMLRKNKYEFEVVNEFSRKNAILTCRYNFENSNKIMYQIGIQIQGGQYRRFITQISNNIQKKDGMEKELLYLEELKWFKPQKCIISNGQCQRKHYNTYFSEKNYLMKYQYDVIQEFDMDSIMSKIKTDMVFAEEIKNKLKYYK